MKRLLLFTMILFAGLPLVHAQRTVTGKITDSKDGNPIAGATISLKDGRSIGITDAQGSFKVNVPTGTKSLVFSFVGYSDVEASVAAGTVEAKMSAGQNKLLSEVVVTGYSSKTKRSSSGSIGTVAIDDIRTQPVASFDQLLQGQSSGVFVKTGSGQPGAAASIVIRGKGSLNGSTAPLYIVDGVQINAADFASLNQGDFETISILKDAAAASIYGSRAAGGVVVITTKKGKSGQLKVNYDFQYGNSYWPKSRLKLMNSAQKLEYELENGNPNGWSPADVDSLSKINTDWEKVFFQTGITQSHQVSASGGDEKTRFYASLGYMDQTGVVKTTGLKRYTGRVNVETGNDKLKVGINTSFGYSLLTNTRENDEYIGSPLNAIRWSLPYITPYDKNGNYSVDPTQNAQPNPLKELLINSALSPQWKGVGNVYAEYKIPFVEGLTAKTSWGADYTQNETQAFFSKDSYTGLQQQGGQGSLGRSFSRNFRYVGTQSLNYKRSFGDHDVNVTLFQEYLKNDFRSFAFTGYGLTLPFQNEAAITAGTADNGFIPAVGGGGTQNSLASYFVDADYGYKNKYFIHGGFRRDGSSRFGVRNKYANFYNIGGSWIISDEKFMERFRSKLDLLKLKLSYGTVGNQAGIGDFASRALYGKVNYAGEVGLSVNSPGNPGLRWEERASLNLGIDFAMLKNRFSGSVEWYDSRTSNLFYSKRISETTGFPSILSNLGEVRNRGVEVTLRGQVIKTKNFRWNVDANFTYNKNTIESLPQDDVVAGVTILKVGMPINTFYLVKYAGVDPANGDPLYFAKDGKTITNVYNPDDNVTFGTGDAPYFGGITNTFNYKGVELEAFWVFSLGNDIFNNDRYNVENPTYLVSNLSTALLHEWRNPGDITDIPRADPSVYFVGGTSHFLENGGFWRLRNVRLSYSFKKATLSKIKINSLRLFVQGENLVTYTRYQGYDPEVPPGSSVINRGAQYPTLKTVTFGINVGF